MSSRRISQTTSTSLTLTSLLPPPLASSFLSSTPPTPPVLTESNVCSVLVGNEVYVWKVDCTAMHIDLERPRFEVVRFEEPPLSHLPSPNGSLLLTSHPTSILITSTSSPSTFTTLPLPSPPLHLKFLSNYKFTFTTTKGVHLGLITLRPFEVKIRLTAVDSFLKSLIKLQADKEIIQGTFGRNGGGVKRIKVYDSSEDIVALYIPETGGIEVWKIGGDRDILVGGWNCDNSLKTVHSRMSKVKIHHVEIQKVIRKTVETEKGNRLVCYSEDGGVVLLTVWDLIEGEMVGCEVLETGRDVRDLVCKGVANLGIVVMTWPEVTMGVVSERFDRVEVGKGEETDEDKVVRNVLRQLDRYKGGLSVVGVEPLNPNVLERVIKEIVEEKFEMELEGVRRKGERLMLLGEMLESLGGGGRGRLIEEGEALKAYEYILTSSTPPSPLPTLPDYIQTLTSPNHLVNMITCSLEYRYEMCAKLNVTRQGGWWEGSEVVNKAMTWIEGQDWGLQLASIYVTCVIADQGKCLECIKQHKGVDTALNLAIEVNHVPTICDLSISTNALGLLTRVCKDKGVNFGRAVVSHLEGKRNDVILDCSTSTVLEEWFSPSGSRPSEWLYRVRNGEHAIVEELTSQPVQNVNPELDLKRFNLSMSKLSSHALGKTPKQFVVDGLISCESAEILGLPTATSDVEIFNTAINVIKSYPDKEKTTVAGLVGLAISGTSVNGGSASVYENLIECEKEVWEKVDGILREEGEDAYVEKVKETCLYGVGRAYFEKEGEGGGGLKRVREEVEKRTGVKVGRVLEIIEF
ncbi:hypothetical protein TrLO_g5493 [Triparma laevis f. longispina]|uniref:Uncharacterized protein n=1 Tax=Triparma laevis f. longispina TaxID=1714387 RepID=A0A9W7FGH9_9STRA|nr:hypothetical protein TrLO_g5493 [Triparma laevis f. longispina]